MILTVKNTIDGSFIVTFTDGITAAVPNDLANRHFQEVQDWIADGNTPTPSDPPPPVNKTSPLTPKEIEEILITEGVVTIGAVTAKKNSRA